MALLPIRAQLRLLGEKIKSVHLHSTKKPLTGFPALQKVKVVLCCLPSMMHGPVSFMPLFFFFPLFLPVICPCGLETVNCLLA